MEQTAIAFFAALQLLIIGQDLYLYMFVDGNALAWTAHFADAAKPLYSYAPVPQAWSLGPEIDFYLLAPFIVRRSIWLIAALIMTSLAVRMGLQWAFGLSGNPWAFRFFPSELALFLTGALGHSVYAAKTNAEAAQAKMLLRTVAVLIVACLAINWWRGIDRLASLSVLAAVMLGIPWLFAATKSIAWDKHVGELSYPLYISHLLAAWIVMPASFAGVYLALLLSLGLSVALYQLVDKPIDLWRQARLCRCEPERGGVVQAAKSAA